MSTPPPGYDAFLSYRSTSTAAAKRVRKALLALARRHGKSDGFQVFLDTSSLLVGALNAEITEALEQSRHLVVLLSTDTAESVWVQREIDHWLTHGGTPERLFLVRLDPGLDLSWDEAAAGFRHPELLPAPLRGCFSSEQKWIDLSAPGSGANEASLTPLYAAIAGVDTGALLLEEAEYQRRRRRLIAGAVGVMAFLLVLSLLGGALALVGRNDAQHQRNAARAAATRARAESDASAALLAVPASYPEAINNVLAAAGEADTPGVRSAMLSVLADTGSLVGAFDSSDHGAALTGATLDASGEHLALWGASRSGSTRLRLVDLTDGTTMVDAEVEAAGTTALRVVSAERVVTCGSDGVTEVDLGGQQPALDRLIDAPGGTTCDLVALEDGSVVATTAGPTGQAAAYVPLEGSAVVASGVGTVAAGTSNAIVSGVAGSWVMGVGGAHRVSRRPATGAGWGDDGTVFLQTGDHRWATATRADGWRPRIASTPSDAVDAAPLVDSGSLTGPVAWISDAGVVGWTGDGSTVRLDDPDGFAGERTWRTRLVPMDNGELLAVWRHSVILLLPPGQGYVSRPQWTLLDNGWRYLKVAGGLGEPGTSGDDPIWSGCAPGQQAALREAIDPSAGTVVESDGATTFFQRAVAFAPGCQVVDGSSGLQLVRSSGTSGTQTILPDYTGQQVTVSDFGVLGDQRAVLVAPGSPTEVITVGDETIRGPWGLGPAQGGTTTALGEQRVVLESGTSFGSRAVRLLAVGGDRMRQLGTNLPQGTRLVAARPDGQGAVLATGTQDGPRTLADRTGTATLATSCDGQLVRYLPAPGFERSVRDATAQIPAALVDGEWVDCRAQPDAVTQDAVTTYGIGAAHGLLVVTTPDGIPEVVSWAPGDQRPDVVRAPPGAMADRLGLDPDGRTAVTVDDRRSVRIWVRAGSGWRLSSTLATHVADAISVSLVDHDSLVLVVGTDGTFDLIDVATGRRLVSNSVSTEGTGLHGRPKKLTTVDTAVKDGYLYAYEQEGQQAGDSYVVDIPIEIPLLQTLLCSAYAAQSCPSSG